MPHRRPPSAVSVATKCHMRRNTSPHHSTGPKPRCTKGLWLGNSLKRLTWELPDTSLATARHVLPQVSVSEVLVRWCNTTSLASNALYIGIPRVSSEVVRCFDKKPSQSHKSAVREIYMKQLLAYLSSSLWYKLLKIRSRSQLWPCDRYGQELTATFL